METWDRYHIDLWYTTCKRINDTKHAIWFDNATDSSWADYEACALAAQQGDERAQRYMAKFMELRMKS